MQGAAVGRGEWRQAASAKSRPHGAKSFARETASRGGEAVWKSIWFDALYGYFHLVLIEYWKQKIRLADSHARASVEVTCLGNVTDETTT